MRVSPRLAAHRRKPGPEVRTSLRAAVELVLIEFLSSHTSDNRISIPYRHIISSTTFTLRCSGNAAAAATATDQHRHHPAHA